MNQHLNIKIFGRVQDVGFRWAARKKALKLGILGFVKNQPDGSLYIEAEGGQQELEEFVAWCKKGPMLAKVANLEAAEGALKSFTSFEVSI